MASVVFTQLGFALASGTLQITTDAFRVALLSSSTVLDPDQQFFSEVSADEISGAGYTAGGESVVLTPIYDSAADTTRVTAPNITWSSSSITARYAVLYKDTGNPATSDLLVAVDFGSDKTSVAGNFTIQWDSGTIFNLG